MLKWFDSAEEVTDVPHHAEYDLWCSRLTRTEMNAIENHIEGLIGEGAIHTSSWMPGSDWEGTPLQVIYEKATRMSEMQAGFCFGLMVMEAMIPRPELWYCKKDPEVAEGTIYWRA